MTRMRRTDPLASPEEKFGRLRSILENLKEINHPYAARMAERGVRPEHIRGRGDLPLLPATTKYDLLRSYPTGWIAGERKEIARIHATNGTTGKPVIVACTAGDIRMWAENMAWCMGLSGVGEDDVVQISFAYGLFTGGLGYHYGAELLGAAVIPASAGFTDRQTILMKDLGATVLACTPSYALRISENLAGKGREGISLRLGFFGGETWSDELRGVLEKSLGIKAIDLYGLSEAMGPGVAAECPEQNGLHISDDFIAEILDPVTLEPKEEGEGELVLTSWSRRAYPLIRYRTRDLASLMTGSCPCGEPSPRMSRVRGRSDDMLIFRGVGVFPSQVEAAVCVVPGLSPSYQIRAWKENGLQNISFVCERAPDARPDDMPRAADELAKSVKNVTGAAIPFEILEPGGIPRSDGKTVRVLKQ
ncbi:MAG: phenylacetate--CoA ligase [Synergistaceae bacterium]|jgi:phenylacetate-CoA ligase|nr:phenylacetate--CoA ligase [Synergistaceae bacterium]